MRKRRSFNVFTLSFLDCISCGLGAVILLFVIVNAQSEARRDEVTVDLSYPHDYIGLTGLLGAIGMTLEALTGTPAESDL